MKLSILILTLPHRKRKFDSLYLGLKIQAAYHPEQVEIITDNSEVDTIGEKRNRLLQMAKGKYVCFIDDDDTVSYQYIDLLMEGIFIDADCCSLRGHYSVDGVEDGLFEHSLRYSEWKTTDNFIKYERYPNHLNCIKSSIAKQFKFPEKNFGEDHDWSKQIHESGLIKTEHYIPEVIYFYKKVTR
jgi:glycosyltransferase involved in cell wall biosynthesis